MSNIFRAVAAKQAQVHGFNAAAISSAVKQLNCSPALESALSPARLAIDVCKLSNQDALGIWVQFIIDKLSLSMPFQA